jgi:hypothetical protein
MGHRRVPGSTRIDRESGSPSRGMLVDRRLPGSRHQGTCWVRLDRRLYISNIATRDLGTKVRERQAAIYRFTIFQSEALQHPPLGYYVVIHCASAPLSSTWQRYRLPSFLCIQIISESTVIQYNMHRDDVAMICLTSCVFPFFPL